MPFRNAPVPEGATRRIATFVGPESDVPTATGAGDVWWVQHPTKPDVYIGERRWDGTDWVDVAQTSISTGIPPEPCWELDSINDINSLKGWTGNPTITNRHTTGLTAEYSARDIVRLFSEGALFELLGDVGAGSRANLTAHAGMDFILTNAGARFDFDGILRAMQGLDILDAASGGTLGRRIRGIDFGQANVSFNASGFGFVNHGMSLAPAMAIAQVNRLFSVACDTFTNTDFRVTIFTAATGAAPGAATRSVNWIALR